MLKMRLILGTLLLILMPFSSYAEEPGIIGSNFGLDFYSRIDDAGNALAQGIVQRRLSEKRTYGSFGCGASWIAGISIDQNSLEALASGNITILVQLAGIKNINLTTTSESGLRQCLVEKYTEIQRVAYQDQDALEIVGNIGLYMDGDIINSDYDIIADIARINAIIFKEKYPYTGTKNASAKSLASLLRGDPIAPLYPLVNNASNTPSNPTGGSATPTTGVTGVSPSGSPTTSATSTLPWALVCTTSGGPASSGDGLFGDGFFDDIGSTLAGGVNSPGRLAYMPPSGTTPSPNSAISSPLDGAFGLSEKGDFYHKPACDAIFCITVNMRGGSQNLLGGFANTSIESLLEQHSKMMDPISWSDLGAQKMTNNSYQLPWLNVKFKDKIAGARIYMTESPQPIKNLETEDTQMSKDAVFDAAFRCAMNEAGLPGDPILANGFIGAGFVLRNGQTTGNVVRTTIPLGPKEMDSLAGCYKIRMETGKKEGYKGLSNDLSEFQAFTSSMMNIILQILETDRKLDRLPTK